MSAFGERLIDELVATGALARRDDLLLNA